MKTRVLVLFALLACPLSFAASEDAAVSQTVIGGASQYLLDAADAIRVGDADRAIRLSLLGLEDSPSLNERIGALSNLCAAYQLAEEYELAIARCSDAIALDPRWQAYHNRALAYLHLHLLDDAERDIVAGFQLFPESKLLAKAQAALQEMRHKPQPRSNRVTVTDI
jgi:tetratricopeptide (TPR) repeat protein